MPSLDLSRIKFHQGKVNRVMSSLDWSFIKFHQGEFYRTDPYSIGIKNFIRGNLMGLCLHWIYLV